MFLEIKKARIRDNLSRFSTIANYGGHILIEDSSFEDNKAQDAMITVRNSGNFSFSDVMFVENQAKGLPGLVFLDSSSSIANKAGSFTLKNNDIDSCNGVFLASKEYNCLGSEECVGECILITQMPSAIPSKSITSIMPSLIPSTLNTSQTNATDINSLSSILPATSVLHPSSPEPSLSERSTTFPTNHPSHPSSAEPSLSERSTTFPTNHPSHPSSTEPSLSERSTTFPTNNPSLRRNYERERIFFTKVDSPSISKKNKIIFILAIIITIPSVALIVFFYFKKVST